MVNSIAIPRLPLRRFVAVTRLAAHYRQIFPKKSKLFPAS
jgi:hypothetical protein